MLPREMKSHPDTQRRWRSVLRSMFLDVFKSSPMLRPSELAERERIISTGPNVGHRYTNEMAPYLVEIMDFVANPWARRGAVRKSARVGYTEGVVGNLILYTVDQDPCPIAVVQPSDGEAESYSKENVKPLIEKNPLLRSKIEPEDTRSSKSTMTHKEFSGGFLSILGSASDVNMRRRSYKRMLVDEVDGMKSTGKEGDPLLRFQKRTDDYEDGVMIVGSTPTTKYLSRIDREFARSDQRYWHVPCPHCGTSQVLEWGGPDTNYGMKWEKELACKACGTVCEDGAVHCPECLKAEFAVRHIPETAYYQCRHCHEAIEEHQKPTMVRAGQWIVTNPTGLIPGWHIDALVSLFVGAAWPKLVQEFLDAQTDPDDLQVFWNQVLGLAWEEKGKKADRAKLEERAEQYHDASGNLVEVPDGVGILTAFVDVQSSWLELLVRGWGLGEESWDVLHERIHGDPENRETWARLEALLAKMYRHQFGARMRIACTLIDAGYLPDPVYRFCRGKDARKVYPSLGDRTGAPEHPFFKIALKKTEGLKLVTLGTYRLKSALFKRLGIETPGRPRYMHLRTQTPDLCNGFDGEYYAQSEAEKHVVQRAKGARKGKGKYITVRERNEFVDCHGGNIAALMVLGAPIREKMPVLVEAARQGRSPEVARRRKMRSKGVV